MENNVEKWENAGKQNFILFLWCPLACKANSLTLFHTTSGFYVSAVQVFWKHCWKRRNCSYRAVSLFPTVFPNHLEKFVIFVKFKIVVCKLFQSLKFGYWESVSPITYNSFVYQFWWIRLWRTIWKKKKNAGNQHFIIFLVCPPACKVKSSNWIRSNFRFANAFYFEKSKIVLLGKSKIFSLLSTSLLMAPL